MGRLVVSLFLVAGACGIAIAQTPSPIDYDTFCKLPDPQAKRTAFLATSAENRGTLARTQVERFRDENKSRLSADQASALADMLAAITAETYADGPQGEAQRAKARAVSEKVQTLFNAADLQAMQPTGPCIAKSK